jgi:hypothetical protein
LLRDAVAILQARAELLAATGRRVWKPSPDMPALVILIDSMSTPNSPTRHPTQSTT